MSSIIGGLMSEMEERRMQITALGHAGIAVRDLEASREFYAGVLGIKLQANDSRRLNFQVSESEQLLIRKIDGSNSIVDRKISGINHIAFIIGNTPLKLDEAARHLEAHRVEYERVAHQEHESLYCRDPDGHLVELYYWPSW
jgi:catechol-2,3-dioxygenase